MKKKSTTVSNGESGRLKSMFATMSGTANANEKLSIQPSSGNGPSFAGMHNEPFYSYPRRDAASYTYAQRVYNPYLIDTARNANTSPPIEEVDEFDLGFFHGDLFTNRSHRFALSHSSDKGDQSCSSVIASLSSISSNNASRSQDTSSDPDQSFSSRSSSISSQSSSNSSNPQESSKN